MPDRLDESLALILKAAELDPLSKFAEMFGTMDIDEIEKLPMEKRQEMNRKPFNKNDDE